MTLAANKGEIVIDPGDSSKWIVYDVSQQSIWLKHLDKPAVTSWITHSDFEEYGWEVDTTPSVHRDVHAKQVGGTHYLDMAIQPWEIIRKNRLGYFAGTAIKYILRLKGSKEDRIEDLHKCIHVIEEWIRDLEDAPDAG